MSKIKKAVKELIGKVKKAVKPTPVVPASKPPAEHALQNWANEGGHAPTGPTS